MTRKVKLLLVGGDEKLDRLKEILPDDIRRGAEGRKRIEESLRHPDPEGGVFLSESLSGCDGTYACHRLRSRGRVNEHILVVAAFARSRQIIADQLAESELKEAGEERAY